MTVPGAFHRGIRLGTSWVLSFQRDWPQWLCWKKPLTVWSGYSSRHDKSPISRDWENGPCFSRQRKNRNNLSLISRDTYAFREIADAQSLGAARPSWHPAASSCAYLEWALRAVAFCAQACVRDELPPTFPDFSAAKAFHTSGAASFHETRLHAAFSSSGHGELDQCRCRGRVPAMASFPLLQWVPVSRAGPVWFSVDFCDLQENWTRCVRVEANST